MRTTCVSPSIEVLSVRPVAGASAVKAFVSIKVGGLTLHDCKIVQQAGQAAWLGLPSRKDDSGKWRPIVECDDRELRQAMQDAALKAWEQRR